MPNEINEGGAGGGAGEIQTGDGYSSNEEVIAFLESQGFKVEKINDNLPLTIDHSKVEGDGKPEGDGGDPEGKGSGVQGTEGKPEGDEGANKPDPNAGAAKNPLHADGGLPPATQGAAGAAPEPTPVQTLSFAEQVAAKQQELAEAFEKAYAEEIDDAARAKLVVDFNRQSTNLVVAGIEQQQIAQQAQAQIPVVEQQFKELGIPEEAAPFYVQYVLESGKPNDPAAQAQAMERAVGRALLMKIGSGGGESKPNPGRVRVPGAEAIRGGGSAPVATDEHEMKILQQTFPGLTAKQIREKLGG